MSKNYKSLIGVLTFGVYTDDWKKAWVVPIYKLEIKIEKNVKIID